MFRLRWLTAGESHGPQLTVILEGIPAGLPLRREDINRDLARRQVGYGRGGRMRIERDQVEILGGVRWGKTLGSPLALVIRNRDWASWTQTLSPEPEDEGSAPPVTCPRPGHADLAGLLKFGHRDIRNVLERASARETAARVAAGAVARQFLRAVGITLASHVVEIGGVRVRARIRKAFYQPRSFPRVVEVVETSDLRCADPQAVERMRARIQEAKRRGDTVGGVFEVVAHGVPVGLGSYTQWDRRLNARLAWALMSIQAIKGVEVGLGFEAACRWGSQVHDAIGIHRQKRRLYRKSNRAGGIEGGISNGEPIIVRAAMKPIATLYRPLASVDLERLEPIQATVERSDVCAVPAAGVVGEAMVALVLADAFLEKFGGDSLEEVLRNYQAYQENLRRRWGE